MKTKPHLILILAIINVLLASHSQAQNLNGFKLDNLLVDRKDISHGGPPRDGIPAINNPQYVVPEEAGFIGDDDYILGLNIKGQAIAYPLFILNWHEIVNDSINGQDVVLSYCPLCGSGMAFSSRVNNQRLLFGVSGLLYNSDILFYDYQTESLWSQISSKAISGTLSGQTLEQLPLEYTTWSLWKASHNNTLVLSDQQGVKRDYRRDPYRGYENSQHLFFKTVRKIPDEFHKKEKVLGIILEGKKRAYPFIELRKNGLTEFNDSLAGISFRVIWNNEKNTAKILSKKGQTITTTTVFWFAWYSFHPDTEIFRAK